MPVDQIEKKIQDKDLTLQLINHNVWVSSMEECLRSWRSKGEDKGEEGS